MAYFKPCHISTDSHQYLIAQISELDKEEQTLILALLKESVTTGSTGKLPLFKVKRADARKTNAVDQPVKWAALISIQYLSRTTPGHHDEDCVPFAKYQHPLEPPRAESRPGWIHSIRQTSPVRDMCVVRFSTFLTSSGQ